MKQNRSSNALKINPASDMNTKFQTVAEAAAHLAEDPAVEKRVAKEIGRNAVVSALLEVRITKGVSQEEVAKAMGRDASTVSRIESGNDRQLKLSDIIGYANALNLQVGIRLDDESLPAAVRIKQCVFKIDDDLKKLAKLAEQIGGDDRITQEIGRFYKEVLFNFLVRFSDSHDRLRSVIKLTGKPQAACLSEQTQPARPPSAFEVSEPVT
jgi:transcriptional regulator with XRE-family HTH domain